jgi:hypothetical protein
MDTKPTFRPEALHDLSKEEELTIAEKKAEWKPDRAKIDRLLQAQEVRMKLPKIYYSQNDAELKEILPCEAVFADDLIKKYEVYEAEDGKVLIRVFPNDFDPFLATIDRQRVTVPDEMRSMFLTVTTAPAQTIQQYANAEARGVMGNREGVVSDSGVSLGNPADIDMRRAA